MQAGTYNLALSYSVSLTGVEDHVKNFRCFILKPLLDNNTRRIFISKTLAVKQKVATQNIFYFYWNIQREETTSREVNWLNKRKIRSFYTSLSGDNLRDGARSLMQATGLGKLKPNTLFMGFKGNWQKDFPQNMDDYIGTIQQGEQRKTVNLQASGLSSCSLNFDAFDINYGVCLLRLSEGLDVSAKMEAHVNPTFENQEATETEKNKEDSTETIESASSFPPSSCFLALTNGGGVLSCCPAHGFPTGDGRNIQREETTSREVNWLNKRKIRSFYTSLSGDNLRDGARSLMQATGLGKLKPNTLFMGFKGNWQKDFPQNMDDYIGTIHDAFDINYGVCLLRLSEGLDVSAKMEAHVNPTFENQEATETEKNKEDSTETIEDMCSSHLVAEQASSIFQGKQGKKSIDVYWISDDGGLTLLIPYLLTRKKRWKQCKVRVFIIGHQDTVEESRKEMLSLLSQFRLDFHDVIVIIDSEQAPLSENVKRFEDSFASFRLNDGLRDEATVRELRKNCAWMISDREMEQLKQKSERKVRLNEIIQEYSTEAALILVSLPVANKDSCPSALYMAWLDALSHNLKCPTLLIRGNQQSVLTFYCQ
ncbi:S12A3 protein, partial [Polyodon spathula]|nr:S12A3 protein [Polyodon spathula]